jgi:RHH-type proline utilization regulon transcriptional repressor/proline dehydrogenase/delta 1-pyrroline-5-carboxylate dehydrogenase
MSIKPERSERTSGDLANMTIATVRRWLAESDSAAPDPSAERLAGVLKDPVGLDFTIGFVDRVVRPDDLHVAARNLERLRHTIPAFLPWYLRAAITVGGGFAPLLPWFIVPLARFVLRQMVGHLVVDATPRKLDTTLSKLRARGIRLNLNLLGEAVLGDAEADRRLEGTRALLARPDVDYVSIKVSSVSSQLSMWAYDETIERVVTRLTPLYDLAANSPSAKFINLDMEEFRDLDLTIAIFKKLLDQPQLANLEAGIVLQAYLPDALAAMQNLTEWATTRRRTGGAAIKVRLVKGANLAMEHVDATVHGWPLATWSSKLETDTNYKRVLNYSLTPERTDAVRIGVAGHNLFDIAYAWLLAKERHVESRIEFEMLLGMATGQAEAVKSDVGGLLLYTPVVHPREFDSAISYLIRRLEENASPENFMSGVFELATNETIFQREEKRFLDSLAVVDDIVPASRRQQDRTKPAGGVAFGGAHGDATAETLHAFSNTPDTDPAIAANRAWGRAILVRSVNSRLGADAIAVARVSDVATLEQRVSSTLAAADAWANRSPEDRAAVLHAAGRSLEASRAALIEVMASETGKTIAEADVEVSEAIDFAHYYAASSLELFAVDDAKYTPSRLIVVTPPWNFPVAIPAGSTLSALASGSGVIIKPARQAARSGAVMVEALWAAGVPRELLTLVALADTSLGKALVAHPAVDRVILTGGWETAELFRSWRPELPLLAETSGKNSIIVTASADLDLAAADVVKSAFGHAGQKCSAASLVILVGSVARSERFRRQLVDAANTLRVGPPSDPLTQMGPIIEPASGKLKRALTTLGEGEQWLVTPRQLNSTGQLWSPGIRTGVVANSEFHLTEYFGPVLGVMTAATLAEAVALQNAPAYGLTAGIHSLDETEVTYWLRTVQAGNLYVNRGITGAVVQRQPFGGWKRSTVGTGAKAGGPNYLATLGTWSAVTAKPSKDLRLDGLSRSVAGVIKNAQSGLSFSAYERLTRAAQSDQRAWKSEFGQSRDVSALGVERNVFRYRPVPVALRLAEKAPLGDLVRLLAAAARTGSPVGVSSALPLPATLVATFTDILAPVSVTGVTIESDAAWLARAAAGDLQRDGINRVRLVGGAHARDLHVSLARALNGSPDIAIYSGEVTASGRVELLTFLHEQAVSLTAHRFGNPDPVMEALPV